MNINEDVVTTLVKEGRLTLQIPEIDLNTGVIRHSINPDHYTRIKLFGVNKKRIAVGRESDYGFLYLSAKGFYHYRDLLKKEFSEQRGHTWNDFENHAIDELAQIKKYSELELAKLEALQSVEPSKYHKKIDGLRKELSKF